MKTIDFVSGGKLGDFIHTMYVVKNICQKEECLANLYISEGRGDTWTYGIKSAYNYLYDLVVSQSYINSFTIEPSGLDEYVDLNKWRNRVATTHAETGKYDTCWSELLSSEYDFTIPSEYAWISLPFTGGVFDTIFIHQSLRHYCGLPWNDIFNIPCKEFIFITSNIDEWNNFKHKDRARLYLSKTGIEMAEFISSCKMFIGNQSSLFALASAFDVPRIVGLDPDPAPFYMGEERYSDNIMWYLNDKTKFIKL